MRAAAVLLAPVVRTALQRLSFDSGSDSRVCGSRWVPSVIPQGCMPLVEEFFQALAAGHDLRDLSPGMAEGAWRYGGRNIVGLPVSLSL